MVIALGRFRSTALTPSTICPVAIFVDVVSLARLRSLKCHFGLSLVVLKFMNLTVVKRPKYLDLGRTDIKERMSATDFQTRGKQ